MGKNNSSFSLYEIWFITFHAPKGGKVKRNIIIFLLIFLVITVSGIYPQWDVGTGVKEAEIGICKSIDSLNKTSTELNQKMVNLTRKIFYLTIAVVVLTCLTAADSIIRLSHLSRKRRNA